MRRRIAQQYVRHVAELGKRMQIVAAKLEEWGRQEHEWQSRRGDTEASIKGFVAEVSEDCIVARLSADYDAALWLELAHEGKWAWIWNVFLTHRDEILEILGAPLPSSIQPVRNPDVQSEYETAKSEMYAARSSARRESKS